MPGASHIVTPYSSISLPTASPTCCTSGRFQVCASIVPIGHAVAHWYWVGVPAICCVIRRPAGPSDRTMPGMPRFSYCGVV